jgi:hypothetical protein
VKSLGDRGAESLALQSMGALKRESGDYMAASSYFSSSRELAERASETGLSKIAKVQLGIAEGTSKLKGEIYDIVRRLEPTSA